MRPLLVPLLALACLSACKGDDALDSGLPASKPADELQPDEQNQFCEAARDYYEPRVGPEVLRRFNCTIEGIVTSLMIDATVASCTKTRDACLAMPDPDAEPVDPNAPCEIGIDWTTCTATVDELEACLTEYSDQGADAFNSISCDKVPEYVKSLPTFDESVLDPGPACQTAQAKCPSLDLGGSDDDNGEDSMGGADT